MNSPQAINLLKGLEQSLDDYCELNDGGKEAFRMAITALELFGNAEQLPSTQPQRTWRWIPCSERLPEEHDSIFKRYYGTDKWRNTMFQSSSEKVITTCEFADGTRFTETNMTCDGKWRTDKYPPRTVIAWTPLPEQYKERREE